MTQRTRDRCARSDRLPDMDDRYDVYCAVDPLFYDSPASGGRRRREFAAARDVPAGWRQQVLGEWLSLAPPELDLPQQGWKVHVSACLSNAEHVLARVWDYCVAHRLSFKYLRGPDVLLLHNSKYAPRGASGKFITIYPADEDALARVCTELAELLAGEPGPYILSDLRIGEGPLYVRYGGFASRFCYDGDELVPAIADPTGALVPDRRNPVFTVPDWVELPELLAPHLAARNAVTTTELPYRIERVIHFSNGGGLYAATDARTGTRCVLKEARPHAGLDATGADAVTRLGREREMLEQLADVPQVPTVLDSFTFGGHDFLALELVEGQALNKLLVERYPLTDPAAGPAELADYTDWALDVHRQVAQAVGAIHERGIVYGDLHLFNIMVRPDNTVALVDFEVAAPADQAQHRPALRNQGFAAPSDRTGAAVDRYALACLGLALFLPLTALMRLVPAKTGHLAEIIAEQFPVPRQFLSEAVREITGDHEAPEPAAGGTGPVLAAFAPEAASWRASRGRLARTITTAATPDRNDRLFPGDIEQFRAGGLNLAHGAAGVLHALAVTGAGRYPEHEQWLAERARQPEPGTRLGFYDGLHGIAYALAQLARYDDALAVLEICLRQPWQGTPLDLSGGLAGIGLNLAELAEVTGESQLAVEAGRVTAAVADRVGALADHPPRYAGLLHGGTGAALLLLRQYERTGDRALLPPAAAALRQDLARCTVRPDGAMEVDEGWRTMPYLARGSVGIGLVLDQYLAHRADEQFAEASAAIRRAAGSPMYVQSGLFAGRAGIMLYLAHRRRNADPEAGAELGAQLRRLAWHALPYQGGLAFPGEQLLRLSMDLATGTAGVLLAMGAASHDEPVDLPFLTPVTRQFAEHATASRAPTAFRSRHPAPEGPPARGGEPTLLTVEGGD